MRVIINLFTVAITGGRGVNGSWVLPRNRCYFCEKYHSLNRCAMENLIVKQKITRTLLLVTFYLYCVNIKLANIGEQIISVLATVTCTPWTLCRHETNVSSRLWRICFMTMGAIHAIKKSIYPVMGYHLHDISCFEAAFDFVTCYSESAQYMEYLVWFFKIWLFLDITAMQRR